MAESNSIIAPVRIYVDGIFDIFHRGHVESFRKAKEYFANRPVTLIVGVISDHDATEYKRKPIFNEEDRYILVRSNRYVDEVIFASPLIITKEFVEEHRIDYVLHGFSNIEDASKQKVFFEQIKDKFRLIPYCRSINTTDIIKKIKNMDI